MRAIVAMLVCVALAGCVQETPEPEASGQPAGNDAVGQPVGGPDTISSGGQNEVLRSGHPLEGTEAPSYSAPGLQEPAPSLEDLRGNVTLVFVWASWCTICGQDEPKLEEIHAEYHERGFEIMAVSHESSQDNAQSHRDREGWAFPAYWDRGVNEHFGLRTYQPNYVLVDGDGTIQWVHQHGLRSGSGESTLRHNIDALL